MPYLNKYLRFFYSCEELGSNVAQAENQTIKWFTEGNNNMQYRMYGLALLRWIAIVLQKLCMNILYGERMDNCDSEWLVIQISCSLPIPWKNLTAVHMRFKKGRIFALQWNIIIWIHAHFAIGYYPVKNLSSQLVHSKLTWNLTASSLWSHSAS